MTIHHMEEGQRPYVVCPRCEGHGTHANPAFDGMSLSAFYEEVGQEEADEFRAQYTTRGGMYDVRCEECNGARVVREECECADCEQERREIADMYAMERIERMYGC